MSLHVEKRYSNKTIARSFVGQWSISIQKALTHTEMCHSAGLLPHVAWSLRAQEMVTQQESSDSSGEACQRVTEPHSGKFWLDVKKAQGWPSTATYTLWSDGPSAWESLKFYWTWPQGAASALTERAWLVQRSLLASTILLSISSHKSNCSEEKSKYLNTCFCF